MPLVKIQRKGQMTLPTRIRSAVGLADGDMVDVKVSGRRIVITPTLVIDRSRFPTADDEYTPAQRRIIDAQLAEGLEDIKAGRVSKAYSNHAEFIADLHKAAAKLAGKKTKRSPR